MPRTKRKILLVDGYNVIHAWDELYQMMLLSVEDAREALIQKMSEFQSLTDEEVILVFDNYKTKGAVRSEEKRMNLTVLFTEELETADQMIERICNSLGREEEVRVATSDFAVQNIAFGRGASRISALELRREYEARRDYALARQKRKLDREPRRNILPDHVLALLEERQKEMQDNDK